MEKSWTIPIAIVCGGIILAIAVFYSITGTLPFPGSKTSKGNPALVRPVDANDHVLGNPAAPIKIVEYADFDCDHCKGFSTILHQVVANEGANGEVAWVFRQLPITNDKNPNGMKHAQASECVAKVAGNDAFWKFADALYANQPTDPSRYGELAALAGAPKDAFVTCYTNAAIAVDGHITRDRQNAIDMGAEGTPFSLILVAGKSPILMGGGAFPYDAVKLLINQALAK